MSLRVVGAFIITATMASAACSSSSPPAGPRVYFAEPKSGAMVKSPVNVVFASDMYTIAAVPPGEVTQVRPGTGHYHLGVDTKCLEPGTVIPKADPWIHFGMGNNTIEMQLTPGQHTLVVQAGDDKHMTAMGLCESITVNVTGE